METLQRKTPEDIRGRGSIEVITGPMFSGKTDELIRRVEREMISTKFKQDHGILDKTVPMNEWVVILKPAIDVRRGTDTVNSENGKNLPAVPIDFARQAFEKITENTLIVVIDEAQFFEDDDLIGTCNELARDKNLRVIVAGLTLDFKGEKWGAIGILAGMADKRSFFHAKCTHCGEDAMFTQRIIEKAGGLREPANYNEPVEVVGGTNLYEARCREHYEIPGKPGSDQHL